MASQALDQLPSLLLPDEITERDAPRYKENSAPWTVWADQYPLLVVQPISLESMSKVVKFLDDSDLNFAVRNTSTGSVSAKDVIVSTHGFKDFDFDQPSKTVTIGSGFDWGEVDRLMESRATRYQIVGARCSWVGVAGSSLVGGLSWLSHDYEYAGHANRSPRRACNLGKPGARFDLALRGGGGNFGVVTALKLTAHKYPTQVFAGVILFPYSSLQAVSKAVFEMHLRPADPKVAMHVCNRGAAFGEAPRGPKPGMAIMMYDSHGETHACSDQGSGWAFDLPDCTELVVGEMSVAQVNALAESFRQWQGNNQFWLSAPLLSDLDEKTLIRSWKWWEECINIYSKFDTGSLVLLEFMQEGAYISAGGRDKTAFPHDRRRHVMQLSLGCNSEGAPRDLREIVMKQFANAESFIATPGKETKEYHVGFLHEWNNLREIYGDNFDKLKIVKQQYDPKNRFNKSVNLAEEKETPTVTVQNG